MGLSTQGRLRAGLRSALKTDCCAFLFQTGGRSLRWLREHPLPRRRLEGGEDEGEWEEGEEELEEEDNHDDEGELEYVRAALFWAGHTRLMEQSWNTMQMQQVSAVAFLRPLRAQSFMPGQQERLGQTTEKAAKWLVVEGAHEDAREWFLRSQAREMWSGDNLRFGFIYLMTAAVRGGWQWLLDALEGAAMAWAVSSGCASRFPLALFLAHVRTGQFEHERLPEAVRELFSVTAGLLRHRAARSILGIMGFTEASVDPDALAMALSDALAASGAAAVHQLEAMLRIDDLRTFLQHPVHSSLVYSACGAGNLVLLQALHARPEFAAHFQAPCFGIAGEGGHTHVVRWLGASVPECSHRCPVGALFYGAMYSHMDTVHAMVRAMPPGTRLDGRELDELAPCVAWTSAPRACEMLEFLMEHTGCVVSADLVVAAVQTTNVRTNVLHLLARRATEDEWHRALHDTRLAHDFEALAALKRVAETERMGSGTS